MKKLYLLLLVLLAIRVAAQPVSIKFDRIGLEQGLSQSTVNAIAQDSQGFMWFGTQDGLNRYDGYSIKIFKHDAEDSNSISDNNIWSLLCDKKGNLWIGTQSGGLNSYRYSTNRFNYFLHNDKDSESISDNSVTALFEDARGFIWVGTRKGLNKFDPSSRVFEHIQFQGTDNYTVWTITDDHSSNIWIGTTIGLFKLSSGETDERNIQPYIHYPKDPNSLSGNEILSICVDDEGKLWVGTWGNGLDILDLRNNGNQNKFSHFIHNPGDQNSLTSNYLGSVFEDSKKNLWIATFDAGLLQYDRRANSFIKVMDGALRSIFEDKTGIIWVGTASDGIKLYDRRKNKFKHFYDDKEKPDDMSGNMVVAILEDKDGELWIGTYGDGLNHFDKKRQKVNVFKFVPGNQFSLSNNNILALAESADGNIWVGTYGGLNRFDKKTGRFIHYKNNPGNSNSISHNEISFLYYDNRDNLLYIGFEKGGFDSMDRNGNIAHYSLMDNSSITSIYRGAQNGLLIGTFKGDLYQLLAPSNLHKQIKLIFKTSDETTYKGIASIYEDAAGILWISTLRGGLIKFNAADGSKNSFTEKDGLSNNVIYASLTDSKGNLWLSTNRGLSKFNLRTHEFKNYDVDDGLQSNEFDQNACFESRNGEMFFGGVNGFNAFYPEEITDNKNVPPVYLTSFKVFDNKLTFPDPIPFNKKIELSYSENFFSFEFVAINYTAPEKNQYAYILEGFDKDWHYVPASNRYASYTNLDPGEYILRVKGSNNDGIWNKKGASIIVIVKPPFWMTWWFRVIGAVLVISVGFIIYIKRVKALEDERALQQEISTQLIKKQEEERRRIAQEIHDSLGHGLLFIKNRANLAMKDFDIPTARKNLNQISVETANILKTVREISHNLRPPELDQLGLSETLRYILFTMRESGSIKVNGEVDYIDGLIKPELEINLVRILQEALGNIIKHSGATECEVIISCIDNSLVLNINDNGKGFNTKAPSNGKDNSTGLGLAGLTERVKILNGNVKIESAIGKGTRIYIEIPVDGKLKKDN